MAGVEIGGGKGDEIGERGKGTFSFSLLHFFFLFPSHPSLPSPGRILGNSQPRTQAGSHYPRFRGGLESSAILGAANLDLPLDRLTSSRLRQTADVNFSDANSLAFGGRLTLFCLVSRSPALVHKSPAFYVHYKY